MKRRNFLGILAALPLTGYAISAKIQPQNDLYISPEALQDIRDWGVDRLGFTTRKEIMLSGGVTRIFSSRVV